jgi:hypothetical protein
MATARPFPPFLPENESQFIDHVTAHPTQWYEYCKNAYQYVEENGSDTETLRLEIACLQNQAMEYKETTQASQIRITQLQTIVDFQKSQYEEQLEKIHDKMNSKVLAAELAKEKALALAQPAVPTPRSSPRPTPDVETLADIATGAPAPPPAAPSESTRQSEKLPDPEKFHGERKDLRRFVSQIHEKLNVNRDRFPTPCARMAYVTNRLAGTPYAQVLPYIRDGVCQLSDYKDILLILERAYGDPNRVNNARSEIMQYRQTNKEFSTFLAEFQRLGLEAEMTDESLATLLEQAVSKELKGMLLHNEPPSRKYPDLAAFLQGLDNRRRYYDQPATRTYATVTTPKTSVAKEVTTTKREYVPSGDPMELSMQYRPRRDLQSDKVTGNCFRCHRPGHRIRDCLMPDTRPNQQARLSPEPAKRVVQAMQTRPISPPRSPVLSRTFSPQLPHQPNPVYPAPTRVPSPNRFAPLSPPSGNGIRLE